MWRGPRKRRSISRRPPPDGPAGRYAYKSPAKPEPRESPRCGARVRARGGQEQEAERLSEAMQAYGLAAQLDPSLFEARYNLGLVEALEAVNVQAALAAYVNALAVQPQSLGIDATISRSCSGKTTTLPTPSMGWKESWPVIRTRAAPTWRLAISTRSSFTSPPGHATLSEGVGSGAASSPGERDSLLAGGQSALSRNHAVRFGEHTRPRVFRPAPSPVGTGQPPVTKR